MATVSEGTKAERFGFIDRYGADLGIRYLCKWLDVTTGGFYKWKSRKESKRAKSDRALMVEIEKIFWLHDANYGSPRVFEALKKEGFKLGKKRVERLMREAGLVGKAGRIYRRKAWAKAMYTRLENLRIKLLFPNSSDQHWVGDLSYIRVAGEGCYLAVFMDLFSRRIVGWSLGKYKTAELVLRSLRQAFRHRQVNDQLIFHTDRGSEYGAELIQQALNGLGIRPSMNRPGKMIDNAHVESFFQSLKTECIRGVSFESESDLRLTLSHYIDEYYNENRLHSSIGYCSPKEYEQLQAA